MKEGLLGMSERNSKIKIDAKQELIAVLEQTNVDIAQLVAKCAIFAPPDVVTPKIVDRSALLYPKVRRGRNTSKNKEKRGSIINGVRIDDNTYANRGIKKILGNYDFKNYEVCHIWPNTATDERYYSMIPNLVLLPRAIAGLTDHLESIQQILQYRAFSLYRWKPDEVEEPIEPLNYPNDWKEFLLIDESKKE